MGVHADAVNAVRAVLSDALAVGQPLAYFPTGGVLFGDDDRDTTGLSPHLVVRVPDQDLDEQWTASKNVRETRRFRVEILVKVAATNANEAYGVTGVAAKRGALTVAEEVANLIDNSREDLVAPAVAKSLDINVGLVRFGHQVDHHYEAVVAVDFRLRYVAGDR